ncbi:MAG: TIGR00341 family protein [Candidatus Obscuribacterales bacterium]|nr:TIGR00341 family protein [Candidatus Obscuribacterales bacterium]
MPTFLNPVEESRLTNLQQRLREISALSAEFLVLLSGSTLIATLGLFQNSPAVVIGAMIIAPLMRPLIGLSLATLTGESRLLGRALLTLIVGTITGIIISVCMALIFQSLELTPEILARTRPTLLDLGVAIFAGAIGAYCHSEQNMSDSLAGVAISVALVPPLSVVGIGLAFNNWSVAAGAALLYTTNLIGITVSGAIVFLILGFTPLHQAKKGLMISALVSLLLIVPLCLSMKELILENRISINIKQILREKTFTFKGVQLNDVRVERFKKPMIVVATVLSPEQPITSKQVALVQALLIRELNMPLQFKLQIIPATEVTADEETAESDNTIVAPKAAPELEELPEKKNETNDRLTVDTTRPPAQSEETTGQKEPAQTTEPPR